MSPSPSLSSSSFGRGGTPSMGQAGPLKVFDVNLLLLPTYFQLEPKINEVAFLSLESQLNNLLTYRQSGSIASAALSQSKA